MRDETPGKLNSVLAVMCDWTYGRNGTVLLLIEITDAMWQEAMGY